MILRLMLSLCLLVCLVAAGPVPTSTSSTIFAVRSSTDKNDVITYKGIYMYKNGQTKKLLETGSALSIRHEPHTIAYFGAKDGIYIYDDTTDKLEKYGTIDERVIGIAKSSNSDALYIISEDHTVYKVTEGGTKKTKVDGADGAIRIELDWEDNLYLIGADKQPYVVTADGTKKIQGLPVFERDAIFYRGFKKLENGLNISYNDVIYDVFADGTSREHDTTAEEQAEIDERLRGLHEIVISSKDMR